MANQQGRPPTAEEELYLQWGAESVKDAVKNLREALKFITTTNLALLSGSIAFYRGDVAPPGFRWTCILLFLAALVIAFVGNLPEERGVDLSRPHSIRTAKLSIITHLRRYWLVAAVLTLAGIIAAISGVAAQSFER